MRPAIMKRTVTVLQDDIDNGKPSRISLCALALATKRELADLPGAENLVVTGCIFAGSWKATLPEEAHQFRSDFDTGRPVESFKFEVDIIEMKGE